MAGWEVFHLFYPLKTEWFGEPYGARPQRAPRVNQRLPYGRGMSGY